MHRPPSPSAAAASPDSSNLAQSPAAHMSDNAAAASEAAQGDAQQLQQLLSAGCEPNNAAMQQLLQHLLSLAVAHSLVAAAAVLLQHGAQVVGAAGAQQLRRAAQLGCEPMIQLLLQAGADRALAISYQASHVAWLNVVTTVMTALTASNYEPAAAGAGVGVGAAGAGAAVSNIEASAVAEPTPSAEAAAAPGAAAAAAAAVSSIQANTADTSTAAFLAAVAAKVGATAAAASAALGRLLNAAGDINKPTAAQITLPPELPPCKTWTVLQVAAARCGQGAVHVLLQQGAAVNASVEGLTAVGWAALRGDAAVVKLLLAAGAVPTASDVLFVARRGSEWMLQWLLARGGDATAVSRVQGTTAVHYAVDRRFSVSTVQQLLAAGCHADWARQDGLTSLHLAAIKRRADTVAALIAAGADADTAYFQEHLSPLETVVFVALHKRSQRASCLEVARVLLAAGASTRGFGAAEAPLACAARHGDLELVRMLLAAGAAVNAAAVRSGVTALHHAAEGGHADIVKALLAAGANPEALANGWTALGMAVTGAAEDPTAVSSEQKAAWKRRREAAQVLVAHGADVNAMYKGHTLLHKCVVDGLVPAVRLLLELGADVNKAATNGRRPLDSAVAEAVDETETTPLMRANLLEITKLLLDAGASTQASEVEVAPLINAAAWGDLTMVRMLLAAGASADVGNELSNGDMIEFQHLTALEFAAGRGDVEIVQELLSGGAMCHNSQDENWPLKSAADNGHTGVVRLLLGNTVDPVTIDDALRALQNLLHQPPVHYEICALLQLHVVRQLQAQQRAEGAADANHADLFAGITKAVEAQELVGVLDRCALSMALLGGWCGDTAGVSEGQDAVAASERGSAAVRADAREALVQLAGARRIER